MESEETAHGTRLRAIVVTAVAAATALITVALISDLPLANQVRPRQKATIAAFAMRDDVIPFQKYGSKLFTLPTLELHYDHVEYFTQPRRWDDTDRHLVDAIERAATEHAAIDVFLLAHSNRIVREFDRLSPRARRRLRLVYNTGCGDAYQADRWLRAGAAVYVGHPGRTSVSPVFYVYFLRRWVRGWTASEATADANALTGPRIEALGGVASGGRYTGAELAHETRAVAVGQTEVVLR